MLASFDPPSSAVVMQLLLCIACSFLFGVYFGKTIADSPRTICENSLLPESLDTYESQKMSIDSDFSNYGSAAFACNTQRAFETLTRLHMKRIKLDEHRVRGDANLAREGTISRKATAADAAENAFRDCMNVMMPELLNDWDEKSRTKQLNIRKQWDEQKEEKNTEGITFKEFELTAAEIENSISAN